MPKNENLTGRVAFLTWRASNLITSIVPVAGTVGVSIWQSISLHQAGVDAIQHTLNTDRITAEAIYGLSAVTLTTTASSAAYCISSFFCCPVTCAAGITAAAITKINSEEAEQEDKERREVIATELTNLVQHRPPV